MRKHERLSLCFWTLKILKVILAIGVQEIMLREA